MKPKFFIVICFAVLSFHALSQHLTKDKLLVLEKPVENENILVAKFFNKGTRNIEEHWTLYSTVEHVNTDNFNELVRSRKIFAHGKHFAFYPSAKLLFEDNYTNGQRFGAIKGYYESGELRYQGYCNVFIKGKLFHYFKSGALKRVEDFDGGSLSGRTKEYYSDGMTRYKFQSVNGRKSGNYISYYPNGKKKRRIKYLSDEKISEKCFDKSGNSKAYDSLQTDPGLPGGDEALKTILSNLDFSQNSNSKDTAIFRILLDIDSTGKASLNKIFFKSGIQYYSQIQDWVKTLPAFLPFAYNGEHTNCRINLAFPVYKNYIVWPANMSRYSTLVRDAQLQENFTTFYWEFTSNIPDYKIYFATDSMPQFAGGENALNEFAKKHLHYPEQAKKEKLKGDVLISFIVNYQGELKSFRIMKGVHPVLDEEAFRVARLMPNWIPGKSKNRNVSVYSHVTFEFKNSSVKMKLPLEKPIIKI